MHINVYTLFAALVSLLLWAGLVALCARVIELLPVPVYMGCGR
jgi:hypothetical protein